jgi:hypothetical protein
MISFSTCDVELIEVTTAVEDGELFQGLADNVSPMSYSIPSPDEPAARAATSNLRL